MLSPEDVPGGREDRIQKIVGVVGRGHVVEGGLRGSQQPKCYIAQTKVAFGRCGLSG